MATASFTLVMLFAQAPYLVIGLTQVERSKARRAARFEEYRHLTRKESRKARKGAAPSKSGDAKTDSKDGTAGKGSEKAARPKSYSRTVVARVWKAATGADIETGVATCCRAGYVRLRDEVFGEPLSVRWLWPSTPRSSSTCQLRTLTTPPLTH